MKDMIIVGAGTAGLSAAIYAQRSGLKALVLEGNAYGGQIVNTPDIENYPGIAHISGFDFATNLYQQALDLGAKVQYEKVVEVIDDGEIKTVKTTKNEYQTKALILATGLVRRHIGLPNEDRFMGKGVSYCATCDGAFFKNKVVAVNGGGNVALEDAQYLADLCEKVYIIHRRDAFRAEQAEINRILEKKNIECVYDSTVTKLNGNDHLESIEVRDKEGNTRQLDVAALFVAIGQIPLNEAFKNIVDLDESGYIKADELGYTNHPGIFAAGDCRVKSLRQLATAASDGANAATSAYHYLLTLK
ncbi:putative thioredoxin-disulfide reductase [Bulleidia extructa W1219]|jgi:thioredoxin-disulfide reductase|uniref:Thioredoxin reductase n=1 Tax=Bulleidia extructa W1219 TaxID=679192 RepID=D2MP57_9FIRM|nr:thioredoxin-disulfide reductase [Bulleidia extructa]EFC05677.1 putative thioredoxin-disulfide reductase [Bulleidia extructa W1219]